MAKFILKEAGLLMAFVVLGGLLLLCLWVTKNVQYSILREYQHTRISLVLKPGAETKVKEFIEKHSKVLRYEINTPTANKDKLSKFYPELRNVITPLESKFFPTTALVTVSSADGFLADFATANAQNELAQAQVLHRPPNQLRQFANVLTVIFSTLWLMTLALVLYFNLERITEHEQARWSLMKMLGAKPFKLFLPLWGGQAARILIASLVAIGVAIVVSQRIQSFFVWNWIHLSVAAYLGFFVVALAVTSFISFSLFYAKYQRISIG